ncbi:T9SS type A sorting domain-containing protein [Flavobacterium silvaticum]|uniref:T9SS type A sorting domain-containing protein n=1 Tax=Flavobacterium silvaticum TaxID=1852020 RepID=A0A972JF20_9FLAO|nr:T9SS type A sorting domain-containing protein [Flavobacterium silvaticum]NMH26771.1 T9SS type A sorting domain-containing protein [Flavobacterium silvaticum]
MTKTSAFIAFILTFFSFQCVLSQDNIWYVSPNGTGTGTSWAQSSGDLQAVINNAVAGDQVWVKQGMYQRAVGQNFSLKDGVSVYGGFPDAENPTLAERNPKAFETILNGNQARVLQASGLFESLSPDTILDGFIIQNGYANVGAGIWAYNCDATFRNLTIRNNTSFQGLGGGVSISNSNSTFIHVLIHHNSTVVTPGTDGEAAGIRINSGNLKFYNCVIADNHAQGPIGGIWLVTSNVYFYNSIIYGNTAEVQFTTFTNDNYNAGSNGNFYAYNCILQGCGGSDYFLEGPQYQVYGHDMGGNLDINPTFNADYSISASSFAINKGNTAAFEAAVNTVDKDFFNNNRIVDAIDIGLSESQTVQSEILYVKQNGTGDGSSWANASGDLQLMMDNQFRNREVWVAEGTYNAPDPYFRLRDSVKVYGGFPSEGNPTFADRDAELHPTVLTSVYRAIIGNFYPSGQNLSAETLLDGFVITNNEDSPEYMYGLFESNSDASYSNIVFTGLNYSAAEMRREGHNSFTDCSFVNNTAINTEGVNYPYTVMLFDRAQSTFTRCLFSGNYAFMGSAMAVIDDSDARIDECVFANNDNDVTSGVGKVVLILNSKATITDSIFEENGDNSYDGGILTVFGTNTYPDAPWMIHPLNVTIDRCTFKHNHNCALWYQGKQGDFLSVNNSLFANNRAAGSGGAITRSFGGEFFITNSTFTQNHAPNPLGGAIYMSDTALGIPIGTTEIRNSIIYNNTSFFPYGQNLWTYRSINIKNSLIEGSGGSANWDGGMFNDFNLPDFCIDLGGNLDTNPMFVDAANEDYRLIQESPAINAGDSALFNTGLIPDLYLSVLDLDGNDRILDDVIDMGAFEFDPFLGTDTVSLTNGISIYPNPGNGLITVHSADAAVSEVKLYDLLGKELMAVQQGSINVSQFPNGIYVVKATLDNNKSYSIKLIKK